MWNDTGVRTDSAFRIPHSALRIPHVVRRHLAVLVLFVAATVVMTWPLARRAADHLPDHGNGDPLLCSWVLAWDAQHLLSGRFAGFFHGNVLYPAPYVLTYSDHLLGYQPFFLPVYAATGNIVLAYNVAYLLTFVLVGYFTYLLVRV